MKWQDAWTSSAVESERMRFAIDAFNQRGLNSRFWNRQAGQNELFYPAKTFEPSRRSKPHRTASSKPSSPMTFVNRPFDANRTGRTIIQA